MTDKKKFHKRLTKKCPECNSTLIVMEYQTERDGVLYSENFVECVDSECGYFELIKNKDNHRLLYEE